MYYELQKNSVECIRFTRRLKLTHSREIHYNTRRPRTSRGRHVDDDHDTQQNIVIRVQATCSMVGIRFF